MVSSGYTDILRSVKILHDDIHRIDFSYLAEFFRFMGVFVCESILVEQEEETDIQKSTRYSAYVYVGKKEIKGKEESIFRGAYEDWEWQDIKSAYRKSLTELPDETIYLYDDVMDKSGQEDLFPMDMLFRLKEPGQKKALKSLIKEVQFRAGLSVDDISRLKTPLEGLIDIFVENKIWFHSLNLQYYKKKSMASEGAEGAFLNAHKELKEYMQASQVGFGERAGRICEYAILWLEIKANDACFLGGKQLPFQIDELAGRCRRLCRRYPRFTNAKVLLGLCYAPSTNSMNEALWAFGDAVRDLRWECFAAPVFYWIGKYYESYKEYQKDAKQAYELANICKAKFRNYFKLGILARNEGNYTEAIGYFKMILRKLELKSKIYFVDPLEIEYLFKTYTQLAYVYYKQKDYKAAIAMGEYVMKVVEWYITPENSGDAAFQDFFKVFYGMEEAAEAYRNILWNRLDIGVAYKILTESYARTMRPDKVKEFQDKL